MPSSSICSLDPVLEIIGDQWTLAILHALSVGPKRTLELFGEFTGLSSKTLTHRLKLLERNRIVNRKSYRETPPRVEYSLTEKGRETLTVIRAISEVAAKWNGEIKAAEGVAVCRACQRSQEDAAADQALPQPKARRQTDVTLL